MFPLVAKRLLQCANCPPLRLDVEEPHEPLHVEPRQDGAPRALDVLPFGQDADDDLSIASKRPELPNTEPLVDGVRREEPARPLDLDGEIGDVLLEVVEEITLVRLRAGAF